MQKTRADKSNTVRLATKPTLRRLRAFAFDPRLATELQNYDISEVLVPVRWEELEPGPVGEYIEVVDIDPASDCVYEPVDLAHSHHLAQNGLAPSEGNPQFHQQMVYAVAMTTIQHFERALGRKVFWNEYDPKAKNKAEDQKVNRLRIYPHALREENAYYDSEKKALLFGYFPARPELLNEAMPGGMVFTCLSHDIIAHETTHAILDGIQRYFLDPSNVDVLAFHEAFADLVALFQHFTYPEILSRQIQRARGDLSAETLLSQLAVQFGVSTGGRTALRDAIGQWDQETGTWQRRQPDPNAYAATEEPHDRGALLVAAVFDAFLGIYRHRTADLIRIATNGTGILPPGDLHPDLVNRLAAEAAKTARHLLQMCIRAIDYCPPVDLTFGDYLRALITADFDLVPEDSRNYRVAVIEAFRKWGIYPSDVRTLSIESLLWQPPADDLAVNAFTEALRPAFYSNDHLSELWEEIVTGSEKGETAHQARGKLSRSEVYWKTRKFSAGLHDEIEREALKLIKLGKLGGHKRPFGLNINFGHDEDCKFEVHSVRAVRRQGPEGESRNDLMIQITQRRPAYLDDEIQKKENLRYTKLGQKQKPDFSGCDFKFRGGVTFILDLETFAVRYAIVKDVLSEKRLERQREFMRKMSGTSLRELYFGKLSAGQRLAELHESHF